ncbi:DUF2313 domain-containing protein [Bacillus sp. Gen3]|nr:DUF2313 domain-containing protein [Bacillus sp. Gen3]
MLREINIINYLPPVFHEVEEIKVIMKAENQEIKKLWDAAKKAMDDQFIHSSSEYGVGRREKMLNIKSPGSDSLETRKFKLLTRYNEQVPFTRRVLKNILDSLCGPDGYELNLDTANKRIAIKIELTVKGMFNAVIEMLDRITPANMIIDVQLRYNQHILLRKYTHTQLRAFTHDELRIEVFPDGN